MRWKPKIQGTKPYDPTRAITVDAALNALGVNADTVFEAQSMNGDERPGIEGYFVVVDSNLSWVTSDSFRKLQGVELQ